MNRSKGIQNQMEFLKAQDNREKEGSEDYEQSTWVSYAKGLIKSFKCGGLWIVSVSYFYKTNHPQSRCLKT